MRYFYFILSLLLLLKLPTRAQNLVDSGQVLPGLWAGEAKWEDYDNDGDQDLALIGETVEDGICQRIARIYRNDDGNLVEDTGSILIGVYYGDLAWGDYNQDGYADLAIVGTDQQDTGIIKLYVNQPAADTGGRQLELDLNQRQVDPNDPGAEQPFEPLGGRYASLAWGDYDSDGALDLTVSGLDFNGVSKTYLYRNKGFGIWQIDFVNSDVVADVYNGDIAWGDVDNDGDIDLALMGENRVLDGSGLGVITELYRNEINSRVGELVLDASLSNEFTVKLKNGDIIWTDYNSDGILDLSMSGRDGSWNPHMLLYRNRPAGVMSFESDFALGLNALDARLAWVDYDNDGDVDLAAAGATVFSDYRTSVFANEAGNISTFSAENQLQGLSGGTLSWADYDNDGLVDLLVTGVNQTGQRQAILYQNQGLFTFNNRPEPPQLNPPRITSNRVIFSWIPGNDVESVNVSHNVRVGQEPGSGDILTGIVSQGHGNAGFQVQKVLHSALARDTYYWSAQAIDGAGAQSAWSADQKFVVEQFVSSDQELRSLTRGALAWGDYDNDGDPDLLQLGQNRSGVARAVFYENNDKVLTEKDQDLRGLKEGDAAWGDYDNDGDLDLVLSGENDSNTRFIELYTNDKNNDTGQLVLENSLSPGVAFGSVDWGDADNDGDLDLAILGQSDSRFEGVSLTLVLLNTGSGEFAPSLNELPGLSNGEARWADIDNDGDLDLGAVGWTVQNEFQLKVYRNDGAGILSDSNAGLEGLLAGDIAWGDYDNDGDLDLAAAGWSQQSNAHQSRVYQNDGSGGFENITGDDLIGLWIGDLAWGDIDNDQDLDLLISGQAADQSGVLQVVENTIGQTNPAEPFVMQNLSILEGLFASSVTVADIDGDGDLDVISMGDKDADGKTPFVAVNDNLVGKYNSNIAPTVPLPLEPQDNGSSITLTWETAIDDGNPAPEGLSYNIQVGTSFAGNEILSGKTAVGLGNVGHGLVHQLNDLDSGNYYWAVQAVDAGFAASAWSAIGSFIIDTVPPEITEVTLSRLEAGIGQTISLAVGMADLHSQVDTEVDPAVVLVLNEQEYAFEKLQFNATNWSGELTITPAMASGNAIVKIRGFTDQKANVLVPFETKEQIVVDTDIPQLIESIPAASSVGVEVDTDEIRLVFSEPLDETTVNDKTIQLKQDNITLGQLTEPAYQEQDGKGIVKLFPAADLQVGTRYTIEIGAAIQDLFGNRADGATRFSFDTQIPDLIETSPSPDTEVVVTGDKRLTARFSAPLISSILTTQTNAVIVRRSGEVVGLNGPPEFNGEDNILTIELAEPLKPGSSYNVTLLSNVAGALAKDGFSWQFLTPTPELIQTQPDNEENDVNTLNPLLSATFDHPIDRDVLDNNISVTIGLDPVEIDDIIYDADNKTVSFSVESGLNIGASYQVVLGAAIGGPLRTSDYVWSFKTIVPLLLTDSEPSNGATDVAINDVPFKLTFDGLLDEAVLGDKGVELRQSGKLVSTDAPVFATSDLQLEITPVASLRVGTDYQLRVPAAVGGPLRSEDYLIEFSTATPVLIGVTPDSSASAVSVDLPEIEAIFNVPLDDDQVDIVNFKLTRNGAPEQLRAEDPVDRGNGRYSFFPAAGLQVGSAYGVQIAASVTGPLGISQPMTWTFRTAVPKITRTSPEHGATDVSILEPLIEAVFDQPLDAAQVRAEGKVELIQGGQPVEIRPVDYDAASRTIRVTPIQGLQAGSRYQLVIPADVGGPLASRDFNWEFVTKVPTVQSMVPPPDAEAVSISNNLIRLELSDPASQITDSYVSMFAHSVAQDLPRRDVPTSTPAPSEQNRIIEWNIVGGLRPSTKYEVEIDRIVFGERELSPENFSWFFTTAASLADPEQGGGITSADGSVELFFPPNALVNSTGEIIIRPLDDSVAKVVVQEPGLSQVGRAFEMNTGTGQLRKPITLMMSYTPSEVEGRDASRLAVFRQHSGAWQRVGGRVEPGNKQVRTAVNELGTFALFEDLNTAVGTLEIGALDCQPRAFSPTGSATRTETDISFQLSAAANVTVRVYNTSGRLERVVTRDAAMAPGAISLPWDGRDEDTKPVASGLYVVVVTAGSIQAEKIVAVVR